jgi:hypothetical protein
MANHWRSGAAAGLCLLLLALGSAAPVGADSVDDRLEKRIDDLEREVKELRALLAERKQADAAGPAAAPPSSVIAGSPPAAKPAVAAPPAADETGTGGAAPAVAAAEEPSSPASGFETVAREVTDRVKLGGYGSTRFETDSPSDLQSTFTLRRLVLTADARIAPRLKSYVELEFERFRKLELEQTASASASDFGAELAIEGTDQSEIALEQAWVEFEANRALRFVGGAVLVPVGRFNLNHDDNVWDTPRRPLVDRGVPVLPSTAAWTEVGAGLTGDFDVGRTGLVRYWLYVMNGVSLNPEIETVVEARDGDTTLKKVEVVVGPTTGTFGLDNKDGKAVSGRVLWSPTLGDEIAGSFYWGRYTPDYLPDENVYTLSFDGATQIGPIETQGEFAFTRFDGIKNVAAGFARRAINKESAIENETTEVEVEFELANLASQKYGYWLYLRYPFFPELLRDTVLGRPFDDPKFAIFARPEQVWFNDLVKQVAFENGELTEFASESRILNRFTAGISYRPTPLVVFSLAYEYAYTNSGKSLASVTNYLGTTASHANSFLAGVAFGF